MSILKQYLPKPHPSKAVFKKHNIPISAVANYLRLTTTYVNSMLNGHMRITPENEAKILRLVEDVECEIAVETENGGELNAPGRDRTKEE